MSGFKKSVAEEAFIAAPLSEVNRRLVDYWFSLWSGNGLPVFAALDPARLREQVPALMVLEVKPRKRVTVRVAGPVLVKAFGVELAGIDLQDLAPPGAPHRLVRENAIAGSGSAAWALRGGTAPDGTRWHSEEVYLPFGDRMKDGACVVLFHTSWRPSLTQPTLDLAANFRFSGSFRTVSLR